MIYCIDVDGTICTQTKNQEYHRALPIPQMVEKIRMLYNDGHIIKIATARGQESGKDFTELTKKQLKEWGIPYHEFHIKTSADFYIDDKAMNPGEFIMGKDYDICLTNQKRGF